MKRAVFTKSNAAALPVVFVLIFASAFVFDIDAQASKKTATVKIVEQDGDNPCAGKMARAKIVESLGDDAVSQTQIIAVVKQCGVDFPLTESARGELTKAGARAGLLDAIAENYRPNAEKPPKVENPPTVAAPTVAAPIVAAPIVAEKKPSIAAPVAVRENPPNVAPPITKENSPGVVKENSPNIAPNIVKEKPTIVTSSAAKEIPSPASSNGETDKYAMPAYSGSPVNKAGLIKVLKGATFNSKEVIKVIEEHGVSFPMTLLTEKELFAAAERQGKSLYSDDEWQGIIASAWENYRSDKTDNPDLVRAIRLYQTSKGASVAEKIEIKATALDLFKKQETLAAPDAQMLYFIGETYNELASLKYQNAFQKGYPTDKQTAEYNQLFDGAIAYHKKNVAAHAEYVDSWEKLAELYGRLKKFEDSIAAYKKLAEFAPKEGSYWIIIGDYYVKLGDYKNALDAKKRARVIYKGRDSQINKDIAELEKKVAAQP